MTRVIVAAAVIEREGALLVTRRPDDAHLGGLWEFPGGKCEADELLAACLTRELDEELGCLAVIHECVFSTTHAYDERTVELHFFRCDLLGEPEPMLGQELRWVGRADLSTLPFPAADAALVERLCAEET